MGCNYSYDNSENDFEILKANPSYLIIKNNSKTVKRNLYKICN